MTAHNRLLQSMRGLAALMVLFGHALYLMPMELNSWFATQVVIFEANSAVVFFFVLSGFVLGESVRRVASGGSALWLGKYAVIRLARLLPVFWLAIIIGAGVHFVSGSYPLEHMSNWYHAVADGIPTWESLISALVWLSSSFNGALWSIQVELWMILLLPPMVMVNRITPIWADIIIVVALLGLGRMLIWPALSGSSLAFLCYANCFYIGVMLPKLVEAIGRFRPVLCSGFVAIISFGLMLWLTRQVAGGFNWGTKLVLDGLLSAPLVAWAHVAKPSLATRLLAARPLVFLGDVSYSFYAYGTPILVLSTVVLLNLLPLELRTVPWGATAITIVCPLASLLLVLPLAGASYRWIELPAIAAGRWLSSRLPMPKLQTVAAI
jgi:peptidoglycan/LPS O-acetylase OafA/YrhL